MRESMIIVPKTGNNGENLAAVISATADALTCRFGGCTIRDATGCWRDKAGKLYMEPVAECVAACEANAESNAVLRELAQRVGHDAKQLAIYVRYPSGDVDIIDTAPQALAA